MSKFIEHINEIFEALYGSKHSTDTQRLYSSEYRYEVESMNKDYIGYIESLKNAKLTPTLSDMVNFLVYIEYYYIGNKHFIRANLDLKKLSNIAKKLIN